MSPTTRAALGDTAPHEAENNGWKYRRDLDEDERRTGEQAADRIRPELQRLRAAEDFSLESTRRTIIALGFPETSVQVVPMHNGSPGAGFAVRTGRVCVNGDVRPDRLLVQVEAPIAEYGCLEPG